MTEEHAGQTEPSAGAQPGPFRFDLKAALIFFVTGACAGMVYISSWGSTADFLQHEFGPSVMMACGRGYVNPDLSAAPVLRDFLTPEMHTNAPPVIDVFSCADLPQDIATLPLTGFQRRTFHMFFTAGLVWWALGVSWSALAVLFGALYGGAVAAVYGLFRLAMHRGLAIFFTLLFLLSPLQLHYLPRLRDFAKAPFLLLALLLLGTLLKKPRGWPAALLCGAGSGAAVGLATGFRAEAILYVGVMLLLYLVFFPEWGWRSYLKRGMVAIAFVVFFAACSWPVLVKFKGYGERCHPFLMGFAELYDAKLGVGNKVYQVSRKSLDIEALAVLNAHYLYLGGEDGPLAYETPEYEAVGDDYLFTNILRVFPADLLLRGFAGALRIMDELHEPAVLPRGITNALLDKVFHGWAAAAELLLTHTRYVVLAALCLLAAHNLRLALAAGVLLIALGGMASVQFATRHTFHLEFVSMWACGFLLARALDGGGMLLRRGKPDPPPRDPAKRGPVAAALVRVGVFLLLLASGTLLPLWGLRWYQTGQVREVLEGYAQSEVEALPLTRNWKADGTLLLSSPALAAYGESVAAAEAPWFQYAFLVAEFAPGTEALGVVARYSGDAPDRDLTWKTFIQAKGEETVRLFFPVFYGRWPGTGAAWTTFEGLEVPAGRASALLSISRVRDPGAHGLLMTATLGAQWSSEPLYQYIQR